MEERYQVAARRDIQNLLQTSSSSLKFLISRNVAAFQGECWCLCVVCVSVCVCVYYIGDCKFVLYVCVCVILFLVCEALAQIKPSQQSQVCPPLPPPPVPRRYPDQEIR